MFDWLRKKSRVMPIPAVTAPATSSATPQELPPPTEVTAFDQVTDLVHRADLARQNGDSAGAITLFMEAHRAEPASVYPLYWLATLLQERGELAQARRHAEAALAIDPTQIGTMLRFGSIASAMIDPMAALGCYERVANLDPDVPEIDALLADQYCNVGRIEDGIAAFDRAIARSPESVVLQQNRLFVLNYSDLLSPEGLFSEHVAWATRHEQPLRHRRQPLATAPDPAKQLRVGLVSPDLRNHAVAHFVEPLLRGHDRSNIVLVCFDTSLEAEDTVTARLKPLASAWHRVGSMSDDALAGAIRQADIDILVDLSGHTKGNRLLVFGRKPAPVQVTWLGYLASTGMASMDYRLTDAHMDPEGMADKLHTEQLVRVPVQACFKPWPNGPAVGPLPAQRNGYITYGSINQWPKVTTRTRDLWARILIADSSSRLKVIAKGGQTADLRSLIVGEFEKRGVQPSRIEVSPFLETCQFLQYLNGIDVALDPFPYGGGTSTMHCLWMGVPVITLRGQASLSRNSVGPLVEAGLTDLIADSPDGYVEIAGNLGHDFVRLSAIRSGLRSAMMGSRLTDEQAFGRAFGAACRQIWKFHCAAPVV